MADTNIIILKPVQSLDNGIITSRVISRLSKYFLLQRTKNL